MAVLRYNFPRAAIFSIVIWLLLAAIPLAPSLASDSTDTPVVRAVLFYSPQCPACIKLKQDILPPIKESYGKQLEIHEVDTTTTEGIDLYMAAYNLYKPESKGVPAMVIAGKYLVGTIEIPQALPGLIDEGLKQGGVDWPAIPGLAERLAATAPSDAEVTIALPSVMNPESPASPGEQQEESNTVPLWMQRFRNDLAGNSLAVIVLAGMVASVFGVGYAFVTTSEVSALKGPAAFQWPDWAAPVMCAAGLVAAGYLSYIEMTHSQAVCGPVGDCNTVQGSPYATLWGFLPVGVLGIFGYIGILVAWAFSRYGPARFSGYSALAMWGMALIGVLFSIYLTFLEPFVIGATCMWCITSAILVTLLLWAATRPALAALTSEDD